jgi:hypothetical protein
MVDGDGLVFPPGLWNPGSEPDEGFSPTAVPQEAEPAGGR